MENSLDAAANSIIVKIKSGGKVAVEVTDDGAGMCPEDARLAIQRHTTSKISSMEDLAGISTLGFRGEALHSIATVSMVTLRSRSRENEIGIHLTIRGDQVSEKMIGCNPGTTVLVENLFYNTPARRAAMRADNAETAAITKLVGRYMVLFPQVQFSYYVNGSLKIMTRKGMSDESVVSSVLGSDLIRSCRKISHEYNGVKIDGFVGIPSFVKRTSDFVVISVNDRYIEDNEQFVNIIREAYLRTIQSHDFPVAILRIKIDPTKINPNIHPQKASVELLTPDILKRALFEAVSRANVSLRQAMNDGFVPRNPISDALIQQSPQEAINNVFAEPIGQVDQLPQQDIAKAQQVATYSFPELAVIGQYEKMYILAAAKDHFFLVDQHALHEKVLFEELMEKSQIDFVEIDPPYLIQLTPEDSDLLESSTALFANYAIDMERLDATTWRCRKVPTFNDMVIPESEIVHIITDTFKSVSDRPSLEEFKRRVVAEIACKSAIRANQMLSQKEMQSLVDRGRELADAYYCPHGRPTSKIYRKKTVDSWFKR